MKRIIVALLILVISVVPAMAAEVSVRARKLKKPVKIAYVRQIASNRWEMRYGSPSYPTEFVYQFGEDKRFFNTEYCEFEFVWK